MNPVRFIGAVAMVLFFGCVTQSAVAADPCYYSSKRFSDGSASCQSGREYRCDDGQWLSTTQACKAEAPQASAETTCEFAGISFSPGSASCQAGTQYRCERNGEWSTLQVPCAVGDSPIRVIPKGETCSFGGATVASGSTICQSSTTFLCNDGEWFNLGTLCR